MKLRIKGLMLVLVLLSSAGFFVQASDAEVETKEKKETKEREEKHKKEVETKQDASTNKTPVKDLSDLDEAEQKELRESLFKIDQVSLGVLTSLIADYAGVRAPVRLVHHTVLVRSITFSPDGKRLASCSYNGTVTIWNVETGVEERTLEDHTGSINAVGWSPDGRRLALASNDDAVRVWNVETGVEERVLTGHTDFIASVVWSPDGKHLASRSWDRTIRVWNTETGVEERVLTVHTSHVRSVVWSSDGKRLASGALDGTIRVWNTETGVEERVLGHVGRFRLVAWTPDGKRLVSVFYDGTVRVWNMETGVEERILEDPTRSAYSLAWSPDGTYLVLGYTDGTVGVWNATNKEVRILTGHTDRVVSIVWSLDGKHFASSSRDGTVKIWNARTGAVEQQIQIPIHIGYVSLCWGSDVLKVAFRVANGVMFNGIEGSDIEVIEVGASAADIEQAVRAASEEDKKIKAEIRTLLQKFNSPIPMTNADVERLGKLKADHEDLYNKVLTEPGMRVELSTGDIALHKELLAEFDKHVEEQDKKLRRVAAHEAAVHKKIVNLLRSLTTEYSEKIAQELKILAQQYPVLYQQAEKEFMSKKQQIKNK